ncbi:DUF1476 domain-containing protein [Ahrensia marina]|uniref:Aldolase n=1 Tax=Ahrensia marina TaxID=1514904 RepID=A0A0M9GLD2_9HYPH|nr:DUF1476 domain-containing protein [Ahrensia marina]KPB00169.1 hypothetical protein SU32_15285 [Ahrensia marina]
MSLEDRKAAFENKFAHDAELRFKAEARRNRLLGEWVAEKLGKSGDEIAAYAREVVASDFEEAGDEDVFRKVRGDFDEANVPISDTDIRAKMVELMELAIQQVEKD